MEIFSFFAMLSFFLNIVQYIIHRKDKKELINEINHEELDIHILRDKNTEMMKIIKDESLTEKEKLEKIEYFCSFNKGFIEGVENHIQTEKVIIHL